MTTKIDNGIHMLHFMDLRSLQARIILVGYPNSNSTGEITLLLLEKLNILVNTSVFANPHNPFIKNAATAATAHQAIIPLSFYF
ncbi:hypothetical protein ABID13_004508 [Enterocloster citroniae]|uniref:NADPH-dependent FMN reductase-like domain-containing protein n=1 Tax=Enterocloster citroniae TaxID=358743 RepID=A0ABV2G3J3_9FIRM